MKLEKDIICSFYPLLLDEYSRNSKGQIYFLTLFAYFNHSEMILVEVAHGNGNHYGNAIIM